MDRFGREILNGNNLYILRSSWRRTLNSTDKLMRLRQVVISLLNRSLSELSNLINGSNYIVLKLLLLEFSLVQYPFLYGYQSVEDETSSACRVPRKIREFERYHKQSYIRLLLKILKIFFLFTSTRIRKYTLNH